MKNTYHVTVNETIKASGKHNFYEVRDSLNNDQIMQGELTAVEAWRYAKFLNVNGGK